MKAVISMGSNLGDSAGIIARATERLADLGTVTATSSVYRSAPWGLAEQPDFLNRIVVLEADSEPLELLHRLQSVEAEFDRTRDLRWGPRSLDLDIVTCDEVVMDTEELVLPHPRAHERAFVLVPWCEIEPDAVLPGRGRVDALIPLVLDQEIVCIG